MIDRIEPVKVAIVEDDYFARKFIVALISRDLRSVVSAEAETPNELLQKIAVNQPDIVLLDPEYKSGPPLGELIQKIHSLAPDSVTICLSQYGEPETVKEAVLNGVRGFFIKDEVMMELASALILTLRYDFVITRSMEARLRAKALPLPRYIHSLPTWKPDPQLDQRHLLSLWLHIIYGMSASLAAREIGLKESSVNKYISEARSILKSDWLDLDLLSPEGQENVSTQDLTFLLFTQIPEEL